MALKSHGSYFKSYGTKNEHTRLTIDALLRLMDDAIDVRLLKLARAIGQIFTKLETATRFNTFGRAKFAHVLERCLTATECLGDWLRPLVEAMPVPFQKESTKDQPVAMVIRA